MWQLVLNLYFSIHLISVKSAWVEIPPVPSKQPPEMPPQVRKPAQFVFGAPKVSFMDHPTTPSQRMLTTVPTTTIANYKDLLIGTIAPLTTTLTPRRMPPPTSHTTPPPTPHRTPPPTSHRTPPPTPYWTPPPTTPMTQQPNEFTTSKMRSQEPQNYSSKSRENKTEKLEDSYSGFLPLLQSIQETLTTNAKKSLKSKISLLTNLRDNLLTNIDERMSSLWSREDTSEARGHDDKEMDFPSNEGALMTIGFLTFAVFLIKLVLKLIHALKEKSMMNPMVVTTMSPASVAFIGRKKRQLEEDDGLNILRLIEEYNIS